MLRIAGQIKSSSQYVPLREIHIESIIRSFAADVTITQIFRNDESTSIEAVYCFPIEEEAAIYNFSARIDNREIIAQLKEKRGAQRHAAYFFEQDEQSQDNFIIHVGSLLPSKECLISISYVTELDLIQGSTIRFVFPTTITPRYSPRKKEIISTKYVQSSPYLIEFRCRIEKMVGSNQQQYIARLTSPSHSVDIDLSVPDAYIVTFSQKNMYLDRDILLDIKLCDRQANTFVVVESGAAMAAVTPFQDDCFLTLDNEQTTEFIFVLDCSGSMKHENKIGLARDAMLFFLSSLPNNCYFNIIQFGARYSCLFNESTVFYNNTNVRIAEKFISQIQADLGSTDILGPLQWLEHHPPRAGHARQVFLLTDGEVSNVSEVLELCRSMASSTRIFSFGLGLSPSRSLVKGLARTTNGRFVFLPPNTHIDVCGGEQLQKAIRRCITNVRVEWNLGIDVENVPNQLPPAYINDRLIVYALTKNQTIPFNRKSSIEIRTDQSYYRLDINDSDRITNNNKMIARLAAKALIFELEHSKTSQIRSKRVRFEHIDYYTNEDRNDIKQRIIDLSLRYNILSSYTAFIGIEKHLNDRNIDTVLREVPMQISNSKALSNIDKTDLFSSFSTPIHIGGTGEKPNDAYYKWQQSPREHVRSHYELSIPKQSNTTMKTQLSSRLYDYPVQEELTSVEQDEMRLTTVHYLLYKQTTGGLWIFKSNRKRIKHLTGKSLSVFRLSDAHGNTQILVTAIVVVLLESKFMAYRSLWDEAAEKARLLLINLFNNDWRKLAILFGNIRIIINE